MSDLIEQLGGYEKAKETYREFSKHVAYPGLRDALLNYRRKNNIFEVGDCVVMMDANDYSNIFKVNSRPNRLYILEGDDSLFYGRLDLQIRHATDEEIKVGHRI